MLLRHERGSVTRTEGEQIVGLLEEDPYLDPWAALDRVRTLSLPVRQSFTIELEDSRIVDAIRMAAEGGSTCPEQYIVDKVVEGLVNDGYIRHEVIDQLKVKDYVEQSLGVVRRRRGFDP